METQKALNIALPLVAAAQNRNIAIKSVAAITNIGINVITLGFPILICAAHEIYSSSKTSLKSVFVPLYVRANKQHPIIRGLALITNIALNVLAFGIPVVINFLLATHDALSTKEPEQDVLLEEATDVQEETYQFNYIASTLKIYANSLSSKIADREVVAGNIRKLVNALDSSAQAESTDTKVSDADIILSLRDLAQKIQKNKLPKHMIVSRLLEIVAVAENTPRLPTRDGIPALPTRSIYST